MCWIVYLADRLLQKSFLNVSSNFSQGNFRSLDRCRGSASSVVQAFDSPWKESSCHWIVGSSTSTGTLTRCILYFSLLFHRSTSLAMPSTNWGTIIQFETWWNNFRSLLLRCRLWGTNSTRHCTDSANSTRFRPKSSTLCTTVMITFSSVHLTAQVGVLDQIVCQKLPVCVSYRRCTQCEKRSKENILLTFLFSFFRYTVVC